MKRTLIATLIGLSALAAGCTGTKGDPSPSPTTGDSTPTSSRDTASGLQSIKPCDLLTNSEATDLGFEVPGTPEKVAASDGCDWTLSGNGGLRTGIRTDAGVMDLNLQGDKVTEIKVGRFNATKVEGQDGSKDTCTIAIGANQTSAVLVISTVKIASGDTAAACERASKAADLIAPKLP